MTLDIIIFWNKVIQVFFFSFQLIDLIYVISVCKGEADFAWAFLENLGYGFHFK